MNADKSNDRVLRFAGSFFIVVYVLMLIVGVGMPLAGAMAGFMALTTLVPEDRPRILLLVVGGMAAFLLVGALWATGLTISFGAR